MLGIGKLYRFVEMEMRGEWIETPFFKRGLLQNVASGCGRSNDQRAERLYAVLERIDLAFKNSEIVILYLVTVHYNAILRACAAVSGFLKRRQMRIRSPGG
jgi:hypothetical protein